MTTTAVVILNYNGQDFLRKYLPSVISFSDGADIYVADNGSIDDSINILEKEFPLVKIITLAENYGFCGGYNRALREVIADYYVLLNSDVEVTQDWLTALKNILDADEKVAAVQPKILSYERRQNFEYAGAGGGFIDSLGYPFCRGRIFDHVETDLQQYNDTRAVFWASGACMMIRSELYHRFNGLDEDFFAHMEEIDLCWKLQRAGFKIMYCGKSTVYHLGAGTLGYSSPNKTYLNFRNGLIMITKHFSLAEMLLKFPLRIALDWIAAVVFVFKGEMQHATAVLRAHKGYMKRLTRTLEKRRELQRTHPHYPGDSIFHGLIIVEYYLKRKKKVIL